MSYVKAFESHRMKGSKCVHLAMHGHFWSRDKDGGHTIRFAIVKNPMQYANLMALSFTELELWTIKVYIVGIAILGVFSSYDLDLEMMTFIYELHPYCVEIYEMYKYELPRSRLSKVIV